MLNYEFRCDKGHATTVTRQMERRNDPVACPECGEFMFRSYSTGWDKPFAAYHHKQFDQAIESRSDEKALKKKYGVVDITGDFDWNRKKKKPGKVFYLGGK